MTDPTHFSVLPLRAAFVRRLAIGLAIASLAAIAAAQDAARRMYDVSADKGRVAGEALDEGDHKSYKLKYDGGGTIASIIEDPQRRSRVIVFRTGPTPAGKVKDRSEMEIFSGIDFGKQWALGMKVFVPADVEFSDGWHLLTQCPQNDARNPPFSLNFIKPSQIAVISRSDADDFRVVYSGDFPRQRWVSIEIEFTMGESGHVRMWLDGKQVTDSDAVFNFKEGRPRCNLKIGTYRGKSSRPFEIRFDDVRLGNARSAVVDR